jgi:aspartate dehydrogenase
MLNISGTDKPVKIGIAGTGAIGGAVAKALLEGIDGCKLTSISDVNDAPHIPVPNVDFDTLARDNDMIIEALPASVVPELCAAVFKHKKTLVLISSCALLLHPELESQANSSTSRIIVPSGALCGLDGVKGLKEMNIQKAVIASTKAPKGFIGAPHVDKMGIDVHAIDTKTCLFKGNALDAAAGFPANINVAATLSLAGIGAQKTQVEIWADPDATGNTHEITVESEYSTLTTSITSRPDPANPKSSVLAAQSIVALLRGLDAPVVVL